MPEAAPGKSVDGSLTVAETREAFEKPDANGDGKISSSEVKAALAQLNMQASDQDVMQLMQRCDADRSGEVCP